MPNPEMLEAFLNSIKDGDNPLGAVAQMAQHLPNGWWNPVEPHRCDHNHQLFAEIASGLAVYAAKTKQTLHTNFVNGLLKSELDEVLGDLNSERIGLHCLTRRVRVGKEVDYGGHELDGPSEEGSEGPSSIYLRGDDTVILVQFFLKKSRRSVSMEISSIDEGLVRKVSNLILIHIDTEQKSPDLNLVSEGWNGNLMLTPIGRPAFKLIEDNYSPKVVEDFRYVVDQFNSSDPSGRLAIIHGEPGTGKTFLLRAFLDECDPKKNTIIFFPPEIFRNFNSPAISKLLIKYSDVKSIVLLVEDGDGVLLERGPDNMNMLASLLSLSDGFIGSLLDVRVFVTTNTKKIDMDRALLRPGRLAKIVEVGSLSYEQSLAVYKRIGGQGGTKPNFDEKNTLAEIYQRAKNDGYTKPPERGMGFKP
jgi:hypothetical protein